MILKNIHHTKKRNEGCRNREVSSHSSSPPCTFFMDLFLLNMPLFSRGFLHIYIYVLYVFMLCICRIHLFYFSWNSIKFIKSPSLNWWSPSRFNIFYFVLFAFATKMVKSISYPAKPTFDGCFLMSLLLENYISSSILWLDQSMQQNLSSSLFT